MSQSQLPILDKPVGQATDAELLTYIVQLRKITQALDPDETLRSKALLALGPAYSEANTRHLAVNDKPPDTPTPLHLA